MSKRVSRPVGQKLALLLHFISSSNESDHPPRLSQGIFQHLLEIGYPISCVSKVSQNPRHGIIKSNSPKSSSRIPPNGAVPARARNDTRIRKPHSSLEVRTGASSRAALYYISQEFVAVSVEPGVDKAHGWLLRL
jgi:hypothetical protein